MSIDRTDIDKAVRDAGGGFFDERLDAITDAVWHLVETERLVAHIRQAIVTALHETDRTLTAAFGVEVNVGSALSVEHALVESLARRVLAERGESRA